MHLHMVGVCKPGFAGVDITAEFAKSLMTVMLLNRRHCTVDIGINPAHVSMSING